MDSKLDFPEEIERVYNRANSGILDLLVETCFSPFIMILFTSFCPNMFLNRVMLGLQKNNKIVQVTDEGCQGCIRSERFSGL